MVDFQNSKERKNDPKTCQRRKGLAIKGWKFMLTSVFSPILDATSKSNIFKGNDYMQACILL
jgi:hypothetical protein